MCIQSSGRSARSSGDYQSHPFVLSSSKDEHAWIETSMLFAVGVEANALLRSPFDGLRANGGYGRDVANAPYFVPELILDGRASRDTSPQSPAIIASFFLRLQPLICCSAASASSRAGNSCENINSIGRRLSV